MARMQDDVPHGRRGAVLRVLCLVVLVDLIGVATGLAIAVQAGRSDPPSADAALVFINGTAGDPLRLDRTGDVWHKGNVKRVIVGGRDVAAAGDYLVQHGVPTDAVVRLPASSDVVLVTDAQRTLAEAQLHSVLVIAAPGKMLRVLKIAGDVGLEPRSLPVDTSTNVPAGELALEVVRYFRYVFMGQ